VLVTGKTGNSVAFSTDGDWWIVTATQCTECNTVRYWAVTPVSSWAVSTDLSANCKLWMRIVTATQCTECNTVRYWAVTPVSSWALSTDLSANCKLWMRIVTATQCTECNTVRYWAMTPVSSWALSTDLSANCKLWMWNLNPIITEVRPNVEVWPSWTEPNIRPMFGVNRTSVHH